jgi:hypothetical protein
LSSGGLRWSGVDDWLDDFCGRHSPSLLHLRLLDHETEIVGLLARWESRAAFFGLRRSGVDDRRADCSGRHSSSLSISILTLTVSRRQLGGHGLGCAC